MKPLSLKEIEWFEACVKASLKSKYSTMIMSPRDIKRLNYTARMAHELAEALKSVMNSTQYDNAEGPELRAQVANANQWAREALNRWGGE